MTGAPVAATAEAGAPFRIELPAFQGTLSELAAALRAGRLPPGDLDLLTLVWAYLAHFEAAADEDLDGASEALPAVAGVVELKLRLSLPRPPRAPDDEAEEEVGEALQAVALLADLEDAIAFLRGRRDERRLVMPARTPRPEVPRATRPLRVPVARLAKAASGLRTHGYFELARDRFSLEGAVRRLREALKWGAGRLASLVPTRAWAERTVVFAAMLELVREGRAEAVQAEPYGPIELRPREAGSKRPEA